MNAPPTRSHVDAPPPQVRLSGRGIADEATAATFNATVTLLVDLERQLYPWMRKRFRSCLAWWRRLQGRGIVTAVPRHFFNNTVLWLRALREIHNCDLPVKVRPQSVCLSVYLTVCLSDR
jgi:hypothetical protein